MSENKDYVSRSDELGNIHISEEVLAGIAARRHPGGGGVSGLAANLGSDIAELLGKKTLAKGVHIQMTDETVTAELSILVAYGHHHPRGGQGGAGRGENRRGVHDRPGDRRRERQRGRDHLPRRSQGLIANKKMSRTPASADARLILYAELACAAALSVKLKQLLHRTAEHIGNVHGQLEGGLYLPFSRFPMVSRRTPTFWASSSWLSLSRARYSRSFVVRLIGFPGPPSTPASCGTGRRG